MKKFIFSAAFILTVCSYAEAQNTSKTETPKVDKDKVEQKATEQKTTVNKKGATSKEATPQLVKLDLKITTVDEKQSMPKGKVDQ